MRLRCLAVLICLLTPGSAFAQANGKLQIHYMDVGQGDGAILISPQGEVVLFDNGVLNQCGKPQAYLQSLGITRIDYHIASHYHSDHIGCTASLLSMFPLQRFAYDRGGSYATATFTNYLNAVGAKRATAVPGQMITLDAGSLNPVQILFIASNANGIPTTDENDKSLVALVRYGNFEAEFGGDLSGASGGVPDDDPNQPTFPAPVPGPAPPPPPAADTCARPSTAPATATAICNDGTFSSSQNRAGTCSSHLGKKCYLCPGVLCNAVTSAGISGDGGPILLASYADIESGVASAVGQIEVYKAHHHGSRFSSNMSWLGTTTPKVAIISVGNSNTYGHPTAEALGRLHATGTRTYWTSVGNGTAPAAGWDVIAGNVIVEVAPGTANFTVRHGSITDTYPMWSVAIPGLPAGAPFGSVDTPSNNALVAGEDPFTGWAVDDSGVAAVEVYRAPVGAEPLSFDGLVFVGNATFVPGARPDVSAAHPAYPGVDRAGWGLMVLSNMLPNHGTGTFSLYAYARSVSGEMQRLGSRTIIAANATSTSPFGTIDTPAQGATVSGTITNFGWVLTPQPKSIPVDGSTITVYIDDVAVGHPVYDNFRSDVATLFPGLQNSAGAIGFFIFDTRTLANGLHTISWVGVDSGGQTQGMGSRFFTVANP